MDTSIPKGDIGISKFYTSPNTNKKRRKKKTKKQELSEYQIKRVKYNLCIVPSLAHSLGCCTFLPGLLLENRFRLS